MRLEPALQALLQAAVAAGQALVRPGQHSQAMRQLRFTSIVQIAASADLIRAYLEQAIQVEKDGLELAFDEKHSLDYPAELQDALDADPALAEAFAGLPPGRQRGYVLHVSAAKQSKTRASRVASCRPRIIAGKGQNER